MRRDVTRRGMVGHELLRRRGRRSVQRLGEAATALLPAPAVASAVSSPTPKLVPPWMPRVIFDHRSAYGRVIVVDEGDERCLRFGSAEGDDQTAISLTDRRAVPMEYIRASALGSLLADRVERTLMIGLGGGAFATMLRRLWPRARIDAVEVDPVVADVARRFFGVQEDGRLHIHVADGRDFLGESRDPYDLIFLDAYGASTVPQPLTTQAFFAAVSRQLVRGGALVVNISVTEAIEKTMMRRLISVFPNNACLRTPDGANLIFFAQHEPFVVAGFAQRATELAVDLRGIVEKLRAPYRPAAAVAVADD